MVGAGFASSAANLVESPATSRLSFLNLALVTALAEALGPSPPPPAAMAVPLRAMNIATSPSTWDLTYSGATLPVIILPLRVPSGAQLTPGGCGQSNHQTRSDATTWSRTPL